MEYKELRRIYRQELLTAGMVLGLSQVAILVLQYLIRNLDVGILQALLSLASFAAIVAVFIIYGRRVAAAYATTPVGFSYGRAFGFSLLVALLSGIIYGVGYYLMAQVVDPVYYAEVQRKVMEIYASAGVFSDEQLDSMQEALGLLNNLFVVVFGYMFAMLLQGGFLALFTSAIVKRLPDPSADTYPPVL